MLGRIRAARRSLPDAFWVVWLGTLVNRAGGFVLPLLPYYLKKARGLDQGDIALVASAYGGGLVLAGLLGGVLADRLGRRATMVGSLVGGALMMLLLSEARGLPAIAAAAAGLGVIGELYRPAVMAYVVDVVPAADRPRAFAMLYWAINLGFAMAPVLAGLLAERSYRALFIGDAVTMAVYAVIMLGRAHETRPAAAEHATAGSLGQVLGDRVFLTFVAIGLMTSLVFYQSTVTLATYLEGQGLSASAYGAIIAVNGVVIIVLQPWLVGRLSRAAVDASRVLAVAAALAGLGFGLHGLGAVIALHVGAVVIWTLGEILQSPYFSSTVATLSTPATRGRYQGVMSMAFGFGAMIGPPAGALAVDAFGATGPWAACAVLGALAAGGYLVTAPGRRARGA